MDLISIQNFESAGSFRTEINSPRTLEACLRVGIDPQELYHRPKKSFHSKELTEQMLDIKYRAFEKKRNGGVKSF